MSKLFTVSPSPHVAGTQSVNKLMYGVVFALMPALALSVVFYGLGAIIVTLVSVGACVLFEFLIQKYILKTRTTASDGSAAVTGLLLAFNLPSNTPIYMMLIGSLVAIGVAKLTFGGLGNNPFNPALVGRVFLLISFPVDMTTYPVSKGLSAGLRDSYIDASSGATPLGIVKEGLKAGKSMDELLPVIPNHSDLFLGNMGGSLGEIASVALLLGLAYMLIKKIITWHIPVVTIGTIFAFTGILWLINPDANASPLFHILTGGVMLGAIFMATDYVTSPMLVKAQVFYAIGIGLLTVIIRVWGAYPEGVSFAILIMNAFVPLMNRYIKPKRFGEEVKK